MHPQLFIYLHPAQSQCLISGTLDASQKFPFPAALQFLHLETRGKNNAEYNCNRLFVVPFLCAYMFLSNHTWQIKASELYFSF